MTALTIAPVQGPICPSYADLQGCMHDSCFEIENNGRIVEAEGPLCPQRWFEGYCDHGSCEMVSPGQMFCGQHGWQIIEGQGSGGGFAGGTIYWATLACGCVDMDESYDIRAAY